MWELIIITLINKNHVPGKLSRPIAKKLFLCSRVSHKETLFACSFIKIDIIMSSMR